jgi:hypothetical protein
VVVVVVVVGIMYVMRWMGQRGRGRLEKGEGSTREGRE